MGRGAKKRRGVLFTVVDACGDEELFYEDGRWEVIDNPNLSDAYGPAGGQTRGRWSFDPDRGVVIALNTLAFVADQEAQEAYARAMANLVVNVSLGPGVGVTLARFSNRLAGYLRRGLFSRR